jgi:hypothetical protein
MRSSLPFDDPMSRFDVFGLSNTALGYTVVLAGSAPGTGDIASNITSRAAGFRPGAVAKWPGAAL